MFDNTTPAPTKPAGNKKEVVGYLNIAVVLKDGQKKRIAFGALEKGNPFHEAIAKKFAAEPDTKLELEHTFNATDSNTADDYSELL